jgi:hypothetical protein
MSDRRDKPFHDDVAVRKSEGVKVAAVPNPPERHQGLVRPGDLDRRMTLQRPYVRPTLASYLNGHRAWRPFEETRLLFHKCVYAWLLPLDLYRWNIAGYTGSAVVCDKVQRPNRRFGLRLHARGTRSLTKDALETIERVEYMKKNTFHARAARFSAIFGDMPEELRPFFYYDFEDDRGFSHPAYRMHSGRDYILVLGPADETPEDEVDWEYFLTPPQPADDGATK